MLADGLQASAALLKRRSGYRQTSLPHLDPARNCRRQPRVPSVKPTASQPTSCSATTLLTWNTAEWTRYARRGVSPSVRADRILVLPGSVPEPLSASGGGTSRSVRPSETAPAGSADPTAVASRQSPVASRFGRPLSGRVGGAPVSCSGRSPGALLRRRAPESSQWQSIAGLLPIRRLRDAL